MKKSNCKKRTLLLDIYKEPFLLQLPDKQDKYQTMSGAILSVLTFVLLLSYAIVKIDDLISLQDYRVQYTKVSDHFSNRDTFGYDDGFMLAAGLVQWDEGEGQIEDLSFGQVKFYLKSWGKDAPYEDHFHELETVKCVNKDYVATEDSVDYKASIETSMFGSIHEHRLKCLKDPHGLNFYGDYGSSRAANLLIAFDRCNNSTSSVPCHSDAAIDEFLRFKYLLTFTNEKRFVQDKFHADKISLKVDVEWFPLSADIHIEYVNQIIRQKMKLIDNRIQFGGLNVERE